MDECEICGKPVDGYIPEYCCNGMDCGCMGRPINPCICSDRCERAVYAHIGFTMEERRKLAGIERYKEAP